MYDNNWTAEEAYELSENLKMDDIKNIRSIKDVSKNIERNREWRRYTKFENKRYEHTLRWMKEEQNRQEP